MSDSSWLSGSLVNFSSAPMTFSWSKQQRRTTIRSRFPPRWWFFANGLSTLSLSSMECTSFKVGAPFTKTGARFIWHCFLMQKAAACCCLKERRKAGPIFPHVAPLSSQSDCEPKSPFASGHVTLSEKEMLPRLMEILGVEMENRRINTVGRFFLYKSHYWEILEDFNKGIQRNNTYISI